MSSSTRSGRSSSAACTASAPVCATPTTSKPGVFATYPLWTFATMKSSSTISTRIMTSPRPPCPTLRPPCPTFFSWQRANRPFCSLDLHESPIGAQIPSKRRSCPHPQPRREHRAPHLDRTAAPVAGLPGQRQAQPALTALLGGLRGEAVPEDLLGDV